MVPLLAESRQKMLRRLRDMLFDRAYGDPQAIGDFAVLKSFYPVHQKYFSCFWREFAKGGLHSFQTFLRLKDLILKRRHALQTQMVGKLKSLRLAHPILPSRINRDVHCRADQKANRILHLMRVRVLLEL